MAAAYKVQNMQQIVDNITPKAVSEEAEEMVDHHSVVAVVDLSVEVCLVTNKRLILIDYI
jgi:hypothetical protein